MAVVAVTDNESRESRYLSDINDIREAFLIYRDQRSRITLNFAQQAGSYSAHLLDVTQTDLLLESIEPRSAMTLLRDGEEFSISCRASGQWVMAENNRVHLTADERGVPYYHVRLPQRLLFQQRRREIRYSMPARVRANHAVLQLNRTHPIAGQVLDLSCGGCRMKLTPPAQPELWNDEIIPSCTLQIHQQLSVSIDIRVRYHQSAGDNKEQICGLEFMQMSVADRRRLEAYVAKLERQQRPADG